MQALITHTFENPKILVHIEYPKHVSFIYCVKNSIKHHLTATIIVFAAVDS